MTATKGSKWQIQRWINERPDEFVNLLYENNHALLQYSDRVEWVSPLAQHNFKEYQDDFLKNILTGQQLIEAERIVRKFWPLRGPVWDGLAIVHGSQAGQTNTKGILLVEAKAHTGETTSAMKAKSLESREKIAARIVEVKTQFGSKSAVEVWTNQYYQLANRLCFLYLLNEVIGIPTWLVLCNFVDDSTHKPTSRPAWLKHQKEIWQELDVDVEAPLMHKVITIYPDSFER